MKRGLVVGELWATRKAIGLHGRQLKLVAMFNDDAAAHGAPAELGMAPLVVAVDTLDARRGQEVLVAYGSGARNVLQPGPHNRHELCDAAIAMLIDADSDPVRVPDAAAPLHPPAEDGRARPQAPPSAAPSASPASSEGDGDQAAGSMPMSMSMSKAKTKRGA